MSIDLQNVTEQIIDRGSRFTRRGIVERIQNVSPEGAFLYENSAVKNEHIKIEGDPSNCEVCINVIVRESDLNEGSLLNFLNEIKLVADQFPNKIHLNLSVNTIGRFSHTTPFLLRRIITEYYHSNPTFSVSYSIKSFYGEFKFGLARAVAFDQASRVIGLENIIKNNTTCLSLDFDSKSIDPRIIDLIREKDGLKNPMVILRNNHYDDHVSHEDKVMVDYATITYQLSLLDKRFYSGFGFEMWSGLCAFPMLDALFSSIAFSDSRFANIHQFGDHTISLPGPYNPLEKKSETSSAFYRISGLGFDIDSTGRLNCLDRTKILQVCPFTVSTNGDRFLDCMRLRTELRFKGSLHSSRHSAHVNSYMTSLEWALGQECYVRGESNGSYDFLRIARSVIAGQDDIRSQVLAFSQGSHMNERDPISALESFLDRFRDWNIYEMSNILRKNRLLGIPFARDSRASIDISSIGWSPGFSNERLCY